MAKLFFRVGVMAGLMPVLPVILWGQGTLEDYERAVALERLTRGTVYLDSVSPRWFDDGSGFVYHNDLPEDRREFIRVDAEAGVREPAFDHEALARALRQAGHSEVESERLPLRGWAYEPDTAIVTFRVEGTNYRWDPRDGELSEDDGSVIELVSDGRFAPQDGPRASGRTGEQSGLTFVNRTDERLALIWLDGGGGRNDYAWVAPGERREQNTYGGHVWLIEDEQGREILIFEAGDRPGQAVIDATALESARERVAAPVREEEAEVAEEAEARERWEALIRNDNVVLIDHESGEEFRLTTDGDREDGYSGNIRWSPDREKFVVMRTQRTETRRIHFVESSPEDQLQPRLHELRYAKPGDPIDISKPHLFHVGTRERLVIDDALFPNPWHIRELRWSPDSSRFTFLYNERGHQAARIISVDADSGEARAVIDDTVDTFIDWTNKLYSHYVEDTEEIIWMSERDGWNHLYLYDSRTGEMKNQITSGEWVVRGVDRVDEEERQVWFRAGGIHPDQDPYHVHFARVNFDGSDLVVLTEGDGTHSVDFSPDRRFLVATYSRVDLPPVTELRRVEDGSLVCELEQADWSRLLETGWQVPERFTAKGRDGETDIYGVIFRPTNFDPEMRYPVIENIYAGPQGFFVPKSFSRNHGHQVLAELGFIVVQMDGMGTNHRSKAFHDVTWQNLGDSGFPDRILWIEAAAADRPWMDLSRVGIYGVSAGGQSALRALLAHGDFYHAAVAINGCHDNRVDKMWWNEQWMGYPIGPHYEEQSNVTQAHRLEGRLLLIVGEVDRNVDPASTMQVVDALVKADKDFELLVLPGQGHTNGGAYGQRRLRDFFVRHLWEVEPRREGVLTETAARGD